MKFTNKILKIIKKHLKSPEVKEDTWMFPRDKEMYEGMYRKHGQNHHETN